MVSTFLDLICKAFISNVIVSENYIAEQNLHWQIKTIYHKNMTNNAHLSQKTNYLSAELILYLNHYNKQFGHLSLYSYDHHSICINAIFLSWLNMGGTCWPRYPSFLHVQINVPFYSIVDYWIHFSLLFFLSISQHYCFSLLHCINEVIRLKYYLHLDELLVVINLLHSWDKTR